MVCLADWSSNSGCCFSCFSSCIPGTRQAGGTLLSDFYGLGALATFNGTAIVYVSQVDRERVFFVVVVVDVFSAFFALLVRWSGYCPFSYHPLSSWLSFYRHISIVPDGVGISRPCSFSPMHASCRGSLWV